MAAKKKKQANIGRAGDGLHELEPRGGKRWWRARLFWIDERTGKSREKRATFQADSKWLAGQHRDKLLAEAKSNEKALGERKRFREVSKEYRDGIKVHATLIGAQSYCRTLDAHFGDWFLDTVTPRAMQEFLDSLTIASVNNVRTALINIFRVAVRKHYVAENLAKKTERRRDTEHREESEEAPDRALTPEQTAAYFDDLEEHEPELYPIVYCQFMLGCRYSEVTALRHEDIDLETGLVKVRRGQYRGHTGRNKGKKSRPNALPPEAVEMVKAYIATAKREGWPGHEELVFPRPLYGRTRPFNHWASTTVDKKIRRSFARVGIAVKGTSHVARHSAITMAEQAGVSEAVRMKVYGHRSKKIHAGYVGLAPSKAIEVSQSVGQAIKAARTGAKTGTQASDDLIDPEK
ncbi:MAG TPA: site-specific integrase [Polyangiaceae bacterium]